MSRRLVYVMGPSGAGKDSVLNGLRMSGSLLVPVYWARRTITRAAQADGEQNEAVDAATFAQLLDAEVFAMHWQANGLSYGVRHSELEPLALGHWVFVNGSRAYLPQLLQAWPQATVVHIGASPQVLAQRLVKRGRESNEAIHERLSRDIALNLPAHSICIDNNGQLADAVTALRQALDARMQTPAIDGLQLFDAASATLAQRKL